MTLTLFLKSHFGPVGTWEEKKKRKITKKTLKRITKALPVTDGLSVTKIMSKLRADDELAQKLEAEFRRLKYQKEIRELLLLGII